MLIDKYKKAFRQRLLQMSPGATWAISHDGLIHLKKDDLIALKDYLLEIAHDVRVVFMYVMRYLMPLAQKTSVLKQARCISWIKPLYIKYTGVLPKFVEVFGLEKIEARLFYKDALNCGDVAINFINANWAEDVLSNIQKPLRTSFQPNLSLDADSYLLLHSSEISQARMYRPRSSETFFPLLDS